MKRMREILFRGKRIDNGEWVEGFFVKVAGHCYILKGLLSLCNDRVDFLKYEVIHKTVGQYTGLKDKNGNKICEDDIVKYGNTINKVVFEQRNGTAYFGVVMDGAETWHFCYLTNAKGMEVIGNIHDNPELLKEGEEE